MTCISIIFRNTAGCVANSKIQQNQVCSGNKGFEDVVESRRSNEIIVVFCDSNNIEVAREEPEQTIRHVSCLGFVDGDGEMRSKCTNFRSSLRKSRSRLKESSVSLCISMLKNKSQKSNFLCNF